MKQDYPDPKDLYATVNKQNRSPQTKQPEEVIYADVNIGRGREQQSHNQAETIYAELNTGKGREQQSHNQAETIYAELNTGRGREQQSHNQAETIYAELNTGRGREQQSHNQAETIYAELSAGRTPTPPRSQKDEITTKLLQNTDFQYGVREVQEWSKVVYGDEHALNKQLAAILDNPQEGEKVLWDLAANPESAGKLAGRQMLGIKSPDRKQAEEGFSPLCSALEKHVVTAQVLHKNFTREQAKHQSYERGESPERHTQEHHHAREAHKHSQEREVQQRRHREERGMAFAM
ncbi:BID domain-containing T4SS effector [Bartonella heixiaziensis]|uniref:BID domain-containing T4SS effector n=1 Tax=Bartonella heixiaziensis TaxID=1461000 RepID=UPI003D207FE9